MGESDEESEKQPKEISLDFKAPELSVESTKYQSNFSGLPEHEVFSAAKPTPLLLVQVRNIFLTPVLSDCLFREFKP